VVLFPDGTKLLEGVPADVAQKVGLRTRAQTSFYDLAIVGGGPAGLAAAVADGRCDPYTAAGLLLIESATAD